MSRPVPRFFIEQLGKWKYLFTEIRKITRKQVNVRVVEGGFEGWRFELDF